MYIRLAFGTSLILFGCIFICRAINCIFDIMQYVVVCYVP